MTANHHRSFSGAVGITTTPGLPDRSSRLAPSAWSGSPRRQAPIAAAATSELADWHDEEASLQIDTIAAACALIAYADGVVRQAEH